MDKKEQRFDEQEAPLKNTDDAFVKVGEDGHPQFPDDKEKATKEEDAKVQQKES